MYVFPYVYLCRKMYISMLIQCHIQCKEIQCMAAHYKAGIRCRVEVGQQGLQIRCNTIKTIGGTIKPERKVGREGEMPFMLMPERGLRNNS